VRLEKAAACGSRVRVLLVKGSAHSVISQITELITEPPGHDIDHLLGSIREGSPGWNLRIPFHEGAAKRVGIY